ncbi:MAG: hypothetical protein R3B13_04935 [Polyangiaceae bacterium]
MSIAPKTPRPVLNEPFDLDWEDGIAAPELDADEESNKGDRHSVTRPLLPTLPDSDPLAHDVVDEGRPTLPVADPLGFDKSEADD